MSCVGPVTLSSSVVTCGDSMVISLLISKNTNIPCEGWWWWWGGEGFLAKFMGDVLDVSL